jgi:hypothetical protein
MYAYITVVWEDEREVGCEVAKCFHFLDYNFLVACRSPFRLSAWKGADSLKYTWGKSQTHSNQPWLWSSFNTSIAKSSIPLNFLPKFWFFFEESNVIALNAVPWLPFARLRDVKGGGDQEFAASSEISSSVTINGSGGRASSRQACNTKSPAQVMILLPPAVGVSKANRWAAIQSLTSIQHDLVFYWVIGRWSSLWLMPRTRLCGVLWGSLAADIIWNSSRI